MVNWQCGSDQGRPFFVGPFNLLRRKNVGPDCGFPLRKRSGSIVASLPPNLSTTPALNIPEEFLLEMFRTKSTHCGRLP